MKLYEEFKLFEDMWKDLYNDDGEYIGPMEKCAKCGQDTPKLIGGAAIKTPFGIYCSKCFEELQDNPDDLLVYNLSVDYNNSEWIKASIDGHVNYGYGEDFIADTISAWNKAKKDPRFVLTAGEVAKIEQGFIASAKKCGININFLSNTSNKEIRAVNENNKIMKITKSELKEMINVVLREELIAIRKNSSLAEARKANPTPPATLDIIKIEPNIQDDYGSGKWRHYDEITYMDPYLNVERKASVVEENPGFGKYFGWGADHSRHWNYAAYDYNGKLLPDIDPNGHVSKGMKDAISGIVTDINDPSDSDEE